MRILICGGAGFIGLNFALYSKLNHPEHELIVIDKLDYSACPQILKENKITYYIKDISNINEIEPLVSETDLVINFAAQSHNDNSFNDPDSFINTNIIGTYNLLRLCTKYQKRYHHISTDEVFGQILENQENHPGFNVDDKYNPTSPYSASKASADILVWAWKHSYNLKASISYSCNNYGPYQHIEKFIPRSITSIITGKKPHIYGYGKQVREWIHVQDHCLALWKIILSNKTGKYIITSGIEKTNLEVVQTINRCFNKQETNYLHVSDRKFHDFKYKTDPRPFQKEFNFVPKHTDFEKEMKDLCQWYINNPWFWQNIKNEVEEKYALENK
ncbi:GDP-mannose 4,6-dehydratase [Actinomyces sp. zg-332]|uniref:dTDP-glucose 4,6-dehydratase n=1 Tax=Actinomyces sp. zg-332 TaxID=2708340 RepID=UPI001421595B|nr:GDP-mannose 4,6-dehydratase [Actinomyces sp. zg-332]QPK94537.1 GDP-mannose 4,6-dehydratase [Actinomyces sp. zg-332]